MANKRKTKRGMPREDLSRPSKWRLQHGDFTAPVREADPETGRPVQHRYAIDTLAVMLNNGSSLVAATTNAGGFGFLAGATIPADQVEADVSDDARCASPQEFGVHEDALADRRVASAPGGRPVEGDVAALGELRLPAAREIASLVGPWLLGMAAAPVRGQVAIEPAAQLVAKSSLVFAQVEIHRGLVGHRAGPVRSRRRMPAGPAARSRGGRVRPGRRGLTGPVAPC